MDVPPMSTSAPVVLATPRRSLQDALRIPACSNCSCRRASRAICVTRGWAQSASCHRLLRKYHCALMIVQGASGWTLVARPSPTCTWYISADSCHLWASDQTRTKPRPVWGRGMG